jgi:thiosulfate/3-mercaptopyruvate sulfurtransferase
MQGEKTMLNASLLALAILAPGEGGKPGYARPELLLEPAELARPETARKYVILDARGAASYENGHVPGAVHIDAGQWAKAFAKGQDRSDWAARIGALGIDVDTPVVIYDDAKNNAAARMWWILRYWEIKDVRLLNGGWKGWIQASDKTEKGINKPKARKPDLKAHSERLATRAQLLAGLKEKTAGQIVDTRSKGEHCGEIHMAKRNGAIPGAKHLEWTDTIDPKTNRFKTPAQLTKLFKEAGIDPSRPATTYCQSGGRASVMAFVLELMSGKPARNYYRSWAEWGNDPDTPIVTPKKK